MDSTKAFFEIPGHKNELTQEYMKKCFLGYIEEEEEEQDRNGKEFKMEIGAKKDPSKKSKDKIPCWKKHIYELILLSVMILSFFACIFYQKYVVDKI